MSEKAKQAVLAVLERYIDRSGAQLCKMTGFNSGDLYLALASLEQRGVIVGRFVGDTYPRRRVYRLVSKTAHPEPPVRS